MPSGLIRPNGPALTRAPGDKPKSTYGGRRAGAGRRASVSQPVRRTVYLEQRHIDQLREWGKSQHRLGTLSQLLRDLIDAGVDELRAVSERTKPVVATEELLRLGAVNRELRAERDELRAENERLRAARDDGWTAMPSPE